MKKYSVLILIVFFATCLTSCSKEKSNRWLVINLNIKDANTWKPITTRLKLAYYDGGTSFLGESHEKVRDLGPTVNGSYYNEIEISKKWHNIRLMVLAGGIYVGGSFGIERSYKLNPDTNNKLNLEWTAVTNSVNISLTNNDCFDEADSLWVSHENTDGTFTEPAIYTGCIIESVYSTIYSKENEVKLKLVSKKNGITNTQEYTLPLEPGIVELHVINY